VINIWVFTGIFFGLVLIFGWGLFLILFPTKALRWQQGFCVGINRRGKPLDLQKDLCHSRFMGWFLLAFMWQE